MDWSSIISTCLPPAANEILAAFEQELGITLPSDYREFLLTYNGGRVNVEHTLETTIDGCGEQTAVHALFPLTSPSTGVIEFRTRWLTSKVGIERALAIGNDGGTGFFFMMLSPRFFGQIYFAYKDEFQASSLDWRAGEDALPKYMGLVSLCFGGLGRLIANDANPG